MNRPIGVPLYPYPCGVCGAAAGQPCKPQRRVIGRLVGSVECDGADRTTP